MKRIISSLALALILPRGKMAPLAYLYGIRP